METLFHFDVGLPQAWLPDETLFSLCSRYHRASGNRLASTTCQALFGHPQQGSAHDFPARLGHFSDIAGRALGTAESIVEHHTLLPFYLRFATPSQVHNALTAACAGSTGSLKFQLGLLTSRFRANHPLKACPMCMHEDRKDFATSYWHREHQFPGLWICRIHRCWLLSSNLKATGVSRFQWILPSRSQFLEPDVAPPSQSVVQFGSMVVEIGSMEGLHLAPDKLSQAFRAVLGHRGLLKGASQRLSREAGYSYADFLKPLLCLEQLGALPATSDSACAEIVRLIGPRAYGVHPIRRLALAAWLFRDLDDLLAISANHEQKEALKDIHPTGHTDAIPQRTVPDTRQAPFFSLLAAGESLSSAALMVGIDTTTAMAWSASRGIATARRPKVLTPELRATLMSMLRKGSSKLEVAATGRVSVQAVTTLLRTEVGLHDAWKLAGFRNAQRLNRGRWARITAHNPVSGAKAARIREPAVYAWLYRNDRDWLAAQIEKMTKIANHGGRRVDWDTRDRELSELVRQAALHLVMEEGVSQLKLFQLYQKIPELKPKLSKLDRLPLTRAAIYAALTKP